MILMADNKHKLLTTMAQTKQQTRHSPFRVTPLIKCTTTDNETGKRVPSLQPKSTTPFASRNTISFHERKNGLPLPNVSERTTASTVISSCCVNDSSSLDLPDTFEANTTSSTVAAVLAKPSASCKNKKSSKDRLSVLERKCLEGSLHFPEDQVRNLEIVSPEEASLPLHHRILMRFSRYRQGKRELRRYQQEAKTVVHR